MNEYAVHEEKAIRPAVPVTNKGVEAPPVKVIRETAAAPFTEVDPI